MKKDTRGPNCADRVLPMLILSCLLWVPLLSFKEAKAQASGIDGQSTNSAPHSTQFIKLINNLENEGISFNSRYLGEFASNPTGGQRQGADFAGELNFGANVSLNKLVGLRGGSLTILFTARNGRDLSADTINNSVPVQQIFGDGQTYQLTLFTYNQEFFGNKVKVSFGRTELANSFFESPLYCQFQSNALCGRPYVLGKDVAASFYPLAVWGGDISIDPSPNYYIHAGIYQSNPTLNPVSSHGFNWNISKSNGFLIPVEIGYRRHVDGGMANDRYDVGVIFDRTHFTSPIYDSNGGLYLLTQLPPAEEYGRTAFYVQAQQMVYQDQKEKERNVYAFAGALFGLSGNKQVARYGGEVGVVDNGPLAWRPRDSLDVGVGMIHYSTSYINTLYDLRLSSGGVERPHQNLIMAEINYNLQINNWLAVMPNLQYVVHPDGLGREPYPLSNVPNAFVAGIQFNVDVARVIGQVGGQ